MTFTNNVPVFSETGGVLYPICNSRWVDVDDVHYFLPNIGPMTACSLPHLNQEIYGWFGPLCSLENHLDEDTGI
eukprot:CAMPEP_0171313588 /NCGR_PEP_ID=MMETSP0816-20121228/44050_1 /TAXON_ID=420281 /ORGANISM="Proboscia inermis, Strain CCAP1064/1" /LENGTH=73 /DNA_ID=CAMNT_0011801225 /DNA_START=354 /DNA_END=575 /DNA_ORIENTATION=+